MERLKLTCGRYLPAAMGSSEERLAALEEYVVRLAAELEFRLGEAGVMMQTLADALQTETATEIETEEVVAYE